MDDVNRILIIGCDLDKHLGLFKDIESRNDVIVHYSCYKKNLNVLKFLRKVHLSFKINRIVRIPFRYIWFDYGRHLDVSNIKMVIVLNGAVDKINYHWLKQIKQKGAVIILYLLDSMDGDSETLKVNRSYLDYDIWDDIYTFEPADQLKYNFKYLGFCYYSKLYIPANKYSVSYDLFFAGGTKGGRSELIHSVYQYLVSNNVCCKFIVTLRKGEVGKELGIEYIRKWLPYCRLIIDEMKSRCIFEIMQKNQTGPSLRYFEAVCYNKKLLTTNSNIVDFPYYHPQWMKIFQRAEDIDIEWLTNNDPVDYQYKGDFSPIKFVDFFKSI